MGKDVPNYGLANYKKMVWAMEKIMGPIMVIVVKKECAVRKKSNNNVREEEEQKWKLTWREKGKSKEGIKVKEEKKKIGS